MGQSHLRRFEALPLRTYRGGDFREADPILAIQIVIASRPQTCDEYRRRLKARAQRLAHRAALRWAAFVETQLSFVRPLDKQYLVVVWYNPFPIQAKRRVLSHERFQEGKKELERRFALVMNVMRQADLQVRGLSDQELLAVMYRFYHWSLSPLGVGVVPRVLSMQPSLYVDVPRTGDALSLSKGEDGNDEH